MPITSKVQSDIASGIVAAHDIYNAYLNREGIFADVSNLLEHQLPEGVLPRTKEHANFLFFLISQDHGVKSWRLYERAKHLYRSSPRLFDPAAIIEDFESDSDENLKQHTAIPLGTRYPNETVRQWYRNASRLVECYDGDARQIFDGVNDGREAFERVRVFRGFGPKTGALVVRTFQGCGIAQVPNVQRVPIPVDIHDTRIAFVCGMLSAPNMTPADITSDNYTRYARAAQRAWIEVCSRSGLDWLILDRALWLLGSRGCSPDKYFSCCITRDDCLRETRS